MKKLILTTFNLILCLFAQAFYAGGLDVYPNSDGCEIRGFAPDFTPVSGMTLTIPDFATDEAGNIYEVVRIGDDAFKGYTEIRDVVFGTNLKHIGARAFSSCINLREAILYNTTESIGQEAFYGCISLKAVNTSAVNIGIGAFEGCVSLIAVNLGASVQIIEPRAFKDCIALTNINIPFSVEQISDGIGYLEHDGAFEGCLALMSVTFSYNISDTKPRLNRIGTNTFRNCISLSRIDFPYSLSTVNEGAFENCASLKHIEWGGPETLTTYFNDFKGVPVERMIFHGDISSRNGFINLEKLQEVRFDTYATKVNDHMFDGCTSLKEIHLDGIETIENTAFRGCTSLTDADLSGVKEINYSAFENCSSLEFADLTSATLLGGKIFYGCKNLKGIKFGPYITKVEDIASLSGLTEYILPDNVTIMQELSDCPDLKRIIVGNGFNRSIRQFKNCDAVTEIKVGPVSGVSWTSPSLKKLTVGNTTPPNSASFINEIYENCTLVVPPGSLEEYKMSYPWSKFMHIEESITATQGVTPGEWSEIDPVLDISHDFKYETVNNSLKVSSSVPTSIYKIDGQLITNIDVGEHTLFLPKGVYILTSGAKTTKIIL